MLTDTEHDAKHGDGSTFKRMAIPLPTYNDSIATDTNNAVRAKAEHLWTANIELQRLIKTVERAGRTSLVAVVEDTWLLPLKEEATLYNKVPLHDFFTRFKGGSNGLEASDILYLLSSTLGWWAEDPRVPE